MVTVNILSSVLPTLMLENFDSYAGKKPDYLSYITALDDSDPYIGSKIEIDDSNVDYYKAGRYPVYVSVTNSSGLSKTDTLYVTVLSEDTSFMPTDDNSNNYYIIGGIIIVFLAVGIIIWYNKKKNKNKTIN